MKQCKTIRDLRIAGADRDTICHLICTCVLKNSRERTHIQAAYAVLSYLDGSCHKQVLMANAHNKSLPYFDNFIAYHTIMCAVGVFWSDHAQSVLGALAPLNRHAAMIAADIAWVSR